MSRASEAAIWSFMVMIIVLCVNIDRGVYCSRAMRIDQADVGRGQKLEVAEIPSANSEPVAIEGIDDTKCDSACGSASVYKVMLPKARVTPSGPSKRRNAAHVDRQD
uniref:Uncharacterized protein n=1 Tax=Picea sitchensis TaxID=3332 RepID=A9P1E7_PICSI|nr:unknown [Picea sitchensis]